MRCEGNKSIHSNFEWSQTTTTTTKTYKPTMNCVAVARAKRATERHTTEIDAKVKWNKPWRGRMNSHS